MAKQAQQTQSDVRKLSSLSTSNRETKKGQSIFLAGKHGAGGGSRTPTRISGQVGLPKFTRTYHLNRKQNGNKVFLLALDVTKKVNKNRYTVH